MESAELNTYAPRILGDLTLFLASTSEDTLALMVETLTVTVKINLGAWLTHDSARLLTRAVLDTWRRNSKGRNIGAVLNCLLIFKCTDPVLLSALTDLLSAMAASLAPGIYTALVAEAFPPLVEILNHDGGDSNDVWLTSAALELIVSVLEGGEKGNLGDGFVSALAPPLFECLSHTQDRDVVVVRTYFPTCNSTKMCPNPHCD